MSSVDSVRRLKRIEHTSHIAVFTLYGQSQQRNDSHSDGYAIMMLITWPYHITTILEKHMLNIHAGRRMQSVK